MWFGVVWCFFFGSTLLQHRAREAAHAGEKAASLQGQTGGWSFRVAGWRRPALVPASAHEAGVRHRTWRCIQPSHLW